MDYKELLIKFMRNVRDADSLVFEDAVVRPTMFGSIQYSEEENAELLRLCDTVRRPEPDGV